MKIAAIDIGTNAVRAKIFETSPVAIEFVEGFRSPLRLGTEVFREGRLSKSKLDSLISTLMKYKIIFEEKRVTQYEIIATSALRDTANAESSRRQIETAMNHPLRIISGLEEANLIRFHPRSDTGGKKVFVDIGGGSTEFFLKNDQETVVRSFQLGAVRNMLRKDKQKEWKRMIGFLSEIGPKKKIIGIGGNIRSFLGVAKKKELSHNDMNHEILALSNLSLNEKIERHGLSLDRADVIDHGLAILDVIAKELCVDSVTSTKWGITDSIAVRLFHEIYAGKAKLSKKGISFSERIA